MSVGIGLQLHGKLRRNNKIYVHPNFLSVSYMHVNFGSHFFLCSVPRNKAPSTEAVVFMVGGGNYIEYQNLQDYAKV